MKKGLGDFYVQSIYERIESKKRKKFRVGNHYFIKELIDKNNFIFIH